MGPRAELDQIGPPWRSPLTGKFCSEADYEAAVSDIRHIEKTLEDLRNPQTEYGVGVCGERFLPPPGGGPATCSYPHCDCSNSETVMLSTGYAEVYREGDVISGGKIIYEAEDGY